MIEKHKGYEIVIKNDGESYAYLINRRNPITYLTSNYEYAKHQEAMTAAKQHIDEKLPDHSNG